MNSIAQSGYHPIRYRTPHPETYNHYTRRSHESSFRFTVRIWPVPP